MRLRDPHRGGSTRRIRIIHRALDAGINFIDTADVYSRGESEKIVGTALAGGKRDNVVLATKVHGTLGDDPNEFGNSRRWILKEVENSLRRLRTDYIDLHQIRRPEDDTDIDQTLGALSDLVRAGKVRCIGSSTFPASQTFEAQWTARERGGERFVCEQPESNRDTLMPGRIDMSTPENQRKLDAADALGALADEAGMTLIEMALAFVIGHPAVTAAIIGPRTMEHLESQITAADVTLPDDVLDRIDEMVPPGSRSAPATCSSTTRRRPALPGMAARDQRRSGGLHLMFVASVAELVDQSWMGRRPIELVPSLGRECALIEQEDSGEVLPQTRASLSIGTGNGPGCAGCDGCGLGEFGDGWVQAIPNDVAATSRVGLEHAPEQPRKVRNMDCRPVLSSGAEHDEVAVVVSRGVQNERGNPSPAVAIGDAGNDHDSAHA